MAKQRKEPSQKQKDYAANIARVLNIKLPEENTSAAYRDFISENQERFAQSRPVAVHFTDEQINRANLVNIVDYARSMGLELKRDGKEYRVKDYSGGFIISPEKNNWNWFGGHQGGGVVQLCMFLEKKTWQEAVGTLLNEDMEPIRRAPDWKPKEEPPKEFNLPPKNNTDKHVYAYLTKTRGIDAEIVKDMLDKGYIYENQHRSCVFVGRDNEGVPRHASVRSTNTVGKAYKKDVSGSQKKYSFSISGTSGNLNVFEAPIDALSYMSLQKLQGKPVNDSYVALGGVTDKALEQYLEDHKDIRQITVCTDGDEAGEKASGRINEKYGTDYEIVRERSLHKDFNEDLVGIMQEENFKRNLHEVVAGKSRVSDSILIGKTPNILVACGAAEGVDFTISKTVIDKCTRPEIRDADGKLTGKTGHGLTENQLYSALMNVKEPVMVLKGNRENSLVVVTEYPDDKSRPIVVSVILDKKSGRTMINGVSSVYGRDKFEEYLERQIQAGNILAFDNKKAEPLLQPIGKWYPKRGEVFSYDATIAYSIESVKHSENISLSEEKSENKKPDKDVSYLVERGDEMVKSMDDLAKAVEERSRIRVERMANNKLDSIMKKLDVFAETADDYEMFADKEFQERLYQTLQECKKMLQDNPDGIITLLPKFYEQSNPNELDVKPDLWNEFWSYLERYGVTGDERFSNRLNNIAAQLETKEQAFTIMKDIREYLNNRLYMTSYMRGDVAVNEDIASYYLENAYRYLNEKFDNPDRNQEMENQIKAVQKVFSLDEAAIGRFYTTNLGGTGWGKGEKPYFYVTEDLQSSFDAAYASYLASDADGRTIGYSNAGMSASHIVMLAGCYYDEGKEVHVLNKYLENQVFDKDSKVLADIEKRLYEELKQRNAKTMAVQTEDFNSKVSNPAPVALQLERIQVAIESTADYVDPGIGFTAVSAGDMPAGTKYRIVTYGENGRLIPYQENSAIYSDRTEVEAYLEEHKDRLENIDYDEMVYQAGKKIADYDLKQRQRIEEGLHSFQFDEDGYLHFSITVNDYDYDGLYRVYAPADGKNRELVSIDNGQGEPFFKENWELIRQHLEQYVNAHPEIGPDGEEIPREKASVYCEQSEHDAFEEGKVYSVFEFDRLMEQADTEWIELRQQEREQYGENAFEELYKRNLPQHQTYAKTKYTVFVPGMTELTLRQDIGDGLGGMIDFVRTTTHKHYAVPLENAFLDGLQQELDNRTMIEEQAVKLQSEMRYEEANALLKTLEQNEKMNVINNTDQTFVLTGAKVSLQMQNILERLASGNEVSVEEINNTKEIQYCRSIADNGRETYLLDGRTDKQNQIMEYMEKLGSASGQLDKDGKMIYDGNVRKGSRLDIVIGLPGAGKSSALVDILSQEFHSKVIDNDMAKEQFTEYQDGLGAKLVHKESQMVCERVLDNALAKHENIVLPKVGSNADKLFDNIITSAKERGYEVNVHFVDLQRDKTLGRMLGRLISDGRFLDPTLIDKYCPDKEHNRCEQSYEALKQNELISGYSRWDNDVEKGEKPFMVESHNLTGEYINNARLKENEKGVADNGRIGLQNNGERRQGLSADLGENGGTAEASVRGVYEGSGKDNEGGRRELQRRAIEELEPEEQKVGMESREIIGEVRNDISLNDNAPENLIKLLGVYRHHKGTPAKELKIGDVLVWNYGETSEVVGMKPSKTGKTIVFQMKSTNDGEVRDRRMNAETLVVVQDKNPEADNNLSTERKQTPFHSKSFPEQVDEVLAGTVNQYNALKVCDTPHLLIDLGCRQLPMLYTQHHLKNALKQKDKNHPEYHGLTKEEIKRLPELIQAPAMVFDSLSRNDSVVIATSAVDNDNAPILVSFKPNGKGTYELEKVDSNFITSVYGKDNNFSQYIERIVESGNMLYCDMEKSQELFRVSGLQLPGCLNNLGFDKIIHQSKNIVNQNDVTGEANVEKAIPVSDHPEPDISISNYESGEPNQVKFDVNIGEEEIHKGEAAFDDDGTVNWIFVDPVPADAGKEEMEQQDTAKTLKEDWDKIVGRIKELLQDLRYKSKEFMRTIGASNAGRTYTQGTQPGASSGYSNMNRNQQSETQETGQNKNSSEQQEAESSDAKAEKKAEEKAEAADRSNKNSVNDTEQYKQLIESHKQLISSRETSRRPLVINAFGGPGSGKSTSCMDICQQLKKQNYKVEYVSEYAKDLVYDKNEKLLDGSPESQFEILKEQLKRVDRLYKSGEVDFIVTDSPILLNEIYNKSLTKEYDSMVASLHNDFNNFNYFMERDASAYQEEGRIQNLEESQKIDQDIKQLLGDKKVRYETYNHDTVEKIVPDIVRAFNRLNGIEEDATEKQKAYAEKIAQTLNITLPEKATKAAYKAFINENHEAFLNSNAPLKEKGAGTGSYQDYLEMVTKDGSRLGDVPKEHYTDELLLAAVRNRGAAVRQIPEDRITTEIAMASVQQYGQNLKYVPEKLKSEEICVAAYISSSGKSICYTPRDMKDRVKEEGQKRLAESNGAVSNVKRQIDKEQIQQKGQEWASRIKNLLKEHETDPDAMVEDIAFAGKFYQYSTRNIQLMRQQNPGITYVAKASLFNEMGYHIKDGEQAMVGRVPQFHKYIINEKGERVYSEKYTPEIKQKLKEGTLKEEQATKFDFVAAFYDISQTDCPAEDYPSVFHMGIPSELHQDAFDAMKKFAEENLGFKVMVTDLKSISLRGSCEPDNKIIRIDDRLEATMALSTLCHEIAHGIIHTSENSAKMSAAQKECETDVMDIMLEASLGLAINESRRDHLFENFQAYKKEQAAKEQPYEVTLEKIIDRVQSKVFRKYIDDINICLDKYLPAEGSRNEEAAEEVVRNLAMLDYAYDMNHEVLIDGKNPLFDSRRMEDYRDLYRKEKDSFRLHDSFMPKLAVFRLTNDGEGYNIPNGGGDLWDLREVQLLYDDTVDKILKHPEQIKPEEQPHVPVGSIVILKENVLSEPRIYLVTRDEGFREITEDMKGMYEQVKNRIDCDFYVRTEYLCIHNLLENGMELEPQLVKKYDHICRAFGYPKNTASDSSIQLMARINLITENLPQSSKDMVAEYVFRTGNFEKAERYAARIGKEQDAVRQMRQEMRLVDSYKYMLWTIEEYEKNNDISEKNRLTTGAYNTSAIPVLSENVSSLSQINQKFLLIRKYASPDSVKYYSIVKDTSSEERYRIAYVELNEYEPEVVYSAVTFKNYEEAEKFYDQYLHTENSRLADSSQAERLAELENRGNQIALSEITSIGKTISAGKQSYMEAGLDEEAALEMLRMEIRDEYPRIKSADIEEVQQELETLKNFKKIVNSYGRERFIELSNLENLKETDVSLRLQKQLAEQADILDKMNITGIDDVKQCVTAALDSSVTASDLEKAFNAIDSAVLSAEFSNLETEFEGFEEYNYVLDTLKAARVTPDKFCYVDFGAEPGPYLYTSDIAGNIYRKSLSSEWDGSIGELNTRLKEAGYEICSSLNDFRAYAANNRLGIFNVPEKEKNEAFIRILESTNDRLPKGQVLSVYDFKDTIDKLSAAGEFKTGITYSLVTRKDQEINSYIDTYSGNSEKNVYEQLYEKAQEKVPELSRVISRQYYQDQINSNERYLVRPLLQQLKRENKSVEDSEELGSVMDSNARLEKIIKELDLSPADAELLKLNAGNIRTEQSVDIQAQQQMNQKTQQKKLRSQQQEGISM